MFRDLDEALKTFHIEAKDDRIFDGIEKLRLAIRHSGESVTYFDYGAGKPDMELTAEEMYQGRRVTKQLSEVCGWGMKGDWARFMFGIVKHMRPAKVLELGTCCGFSSAYMSYGCDDSLIITLEGAPEIHAVAEKVHSSLDRKNIVRVTGRFQDRLQGVLSEHGHFDLAFIDGHHDKDATVGYFRQIIPHSTGSTLIFDDIAWSDGMKEAWDVIRNDACVEEHSDLGKIGVIKLRG